VELSGPTRELMTARGISQILLSLAFCREFATATGLAVKHTSHRVTEDTALDD
jgi:holo-[acyl-carrier protein] synthase